MRGRGLPPAALIAAPEAPAWRGGGAARGRSREARRRRAAVADRRQARVLGSCAHSFTATCSTRVRKPKPLSRLLARSSPTAAAMQLRILDLGVGSGALLCALLQRIRQRARSWRRRLRRRRAIARRNVAACGFAARAEIRVGSWARWGLLVLSISSSRTRPIFRPPTSPGFRARCATTTRALRSTAGSTGSPPIGRSCLRRRALLCARRLAPRRGGRGTGAVRAGDRRRRRAFASARPIGTSRASSGSWPRGRRGPFRGCRFAARGCVGLERRQRVIE